MSDPKCQPNPEEKHLPEGAGETTLPLQSEESVRPPSPSHSLLPEETTSDSTPSLRREYDMIKLFEAVAKFRWRNGILPTRRAIIPDFLNEVKDFVPLGLSEGGLVRKLYKERKNFLQKSTRGPDCPAPERYLYELQLKAFGLQSLCRTFKRKRNVSGSAEPARKADVTKKRRSASKKGKGVQTDSGSSPTT